MLISLYLYTALVCIINISCAANLYTGPFQGFVAFERKVLLLPFYVCNPNDSYPTQLKPMRPNQVTPHTYCY